MNPRLAPRPQISLRRNQTCFICRSTFVCSLVFHLFNQFLTGHNINARFFGKCLKFRTLLFVNHVIIIFETSGLQKERFFRVSPLSFTVCHDSIQTFFYQLFDSRPKCRIMINK